MGRSSAGNGIRTYMGISYSLPYSTGRAGGKIGIRTIHFCTLISFDKSAFFPAMIFVISTWYVNQPPGFLKDF